MATRDPWFDNAKMALVTLVVVGHAYTLLPSDDDTTSHLYDFLYAWHVPAFVFVTGYLSRSFTYSPQRFWQLFRTVVVPYLLFECAMALFRIHVGGEELENLFQDPHWPMWYLAALFFWRLLTPLFTALGTAVALPLAVAVSLLAGLFAGDTLDAARVLGLLPFFVLGLKATPERLELLRSAPARVAAVPALAVVALAVHDLDGWAATEWLYYRARYDELVTSDLEAAGIRALVMLLGLCGGAAFLALVPRTGGWFARMGVSTLVVYLFHGFAVKGLSYTGFPGWAEGHPALALAVVTPGAVLLALALAWRPLARHLEVAVDPFGAAQRHAAHTVDVSMAVVAEEQAPAREMPAALAPTPVPEPAQRGRG